MRSKLTIPVFLITIFLLVPPSIAKPAPVLNSELARKIWKEFKQNSAISEIAGKMWLEYIKKSTSLSGDPQLSVDENRKIFCRYGLQALAWGEVKRNELSNEVELLRKLNKILPNADLQDELQEYKRMAQSHQVVLADYFKVYMNCRSLGYSETTY